MQMRIVRRLAIIGIFAVVYFVVGKIGLEVAFIHANASPVWPAAGIAVAGLILGGLELWPAILLGAFLVNVTTEGNAWTSLAIATGNTLEALAGAWLVNRYAGGRHAFDHAHNVFRFAALAGMASTTISASIGVTSLLLGGFANIQDWGVIWRTWWLGDASGIILAAPFIMNLAVHPAHQLSHRRFVELLATLVLLGLIGSIVFDEVYPLTGNGYLLLFMVVPMLVWIAFRFSQRETAIALLLLSGIAVLGTLHGHGPFSVGTANESLLFLQAFLGIVGLMSMTLTSAVSERRASEQRLDAQQAATRILAESTTLQEAMPLVLQTLCEKLGWAVGCYWRPTGSGKKIQLIEAWARPGEGFSEFVDASRPLELNPGEGIIGRSWQSRSPIWVSDVLRDSNFPRAEVAGKADLHSAVAFPILVAGEVVGVVEFFADEFRGRQEEFLTMVTSVGTQIGQFTERTASESMLARLAGIVESSSDAIYSKTLDGVVTSWNSAAETLFGYSSAEILGRDVTVLVPPEMLVQEKEMVDRITRGEVITGYETVRLRKDQTRVDISLTISPMRVRNEIIGASAIARDITERRRAAAELERQKEAAEAANVAKDIFMAMLSHELRAPLAPVLTAIDDLEPAVAPEQGGILQMIRRNIDHEARLIDDLLDLTRIAKGKLDLRRDALDVHAVIRHVLDLCRAEINRRQIRVGLHFDAKRSWINADATRLQQIVWNLLKNAVKFSSEGGEVTIRTENPDDESLEVEVSDRGIGIEPAVMLRLFAPFEQGEQSTRRQYGGLGLGLAIAKAIAEAHGGCLTAQSDGRDRGASFKLKMGPLLAQPGETPGEPVSTLGITRQTTPADLRILLVEDHEDTRRSMERLLKRRGYGVESAGDVRSALELAESRHFDILVSDIALPDATGCELMRQMQMKYPIKGIAVSGFGTQRDREMSMAAGFSQHLVKPVRIRELEMAIWDSVES